MNLRVNLASQDAIRLKRRNIAYEYHTILEYNTRVLRVLVWSLILASFSVPSISSTSFLDYKYLNHSCHPSPRATPSLFIHQTPAPRCQPIVLPLVTSLGGISPGLLQIGHGWKIMIELRGKHQRACKYSNAPRKMHLVVTYPRF